LDWGAVSDLLEGLVLLAVAVFAAFASFFLAAFSAFLAAFLPLGSASCNHSRMKLDYTVKSGH
jgi:hypothetical protein